LYDTKRLINPLPSPENYETAVRYFLARYRTAAGRAHGSDPCTWYYTPWNEPNLAGEQPTSMWKIRPDYWKSTEPQAEAPGSNTTIESNGFGAAAAGVYFSRLKDTLNAWCSAKDSKGNWNSPQHSFTGYVIAGDLVASSHWSWDSSHWRITYKRYLPNDIHNWAWHDYRGINGTIHRSDRSIQ